ncbi:RodZ domain-containing protein [Limnohabitans sp.]|uniref:RodZ domain-containing protein n=1 Tax=Limnohabitans sp. TaxID=1907725 RepID=UPI002AFF4580|nr:RodZ domain-containing protein [Limnohabitans sp.]
MTEHTHSDNVPSTPTAGGLLKAARQAAGVHLAVLSVNLKVPVRQLESLEADQYMADQSPVFARGLAASVCRHLRVDSAPILALMPMSSNYLESNGAVRQALSAPPDLGNLRRVRFGASSQTWWMATGMLVLIAALIWLPNPAHWAWFENLRPSVSSSEAAAPAAAAAPATPVEPVSPASAAVSTPSQELPLALPVAPASLPPVVPMPSELVFSAQNVSWIEVRDAQKQLIWNGVLNAGDLKRLPVSFPVSVVVGRSDAVQLSVQGQPFDLKPHTQVNTARFEVKP